MFEPLFTPLFSSLFSSLIAAAQRIFITADAVLETHFPLENTKTLTGDFRVGALCVLPTAATTVTLHGQLASVSNYFKVLSTGFASISIGGSVVTSTVLATKDSKLRIYDVELSGNDFLFQEDGVTIDTVTDAGAAANSFVIDVLCQSNGADFFNGTYADPKITDITTPSNSESWKINRPSPATTEAAIGGGNDLTYNNAPDSTRELFTLNQSVTPNRWVGVTELWVFGIVVPDGTSIVNEILAGDVSVLGKNMDYITTLAWVNLTGRVRVRVGADTNTNSGVKTNDSGSVTTIKNSGALERLQLQDPNGGAIADSVTVSTKRVLEVA